MKRTSLILITICILFSCKEAKKPDSIGLAHIATMQDDDIIARPFDLAIKDSILFVSTRGAETAFHLYSTNQEKHLASVGNYGNGPMEFGQLRKLYTLNNDIYTYDVSTKRFYQLDFNYSPPYKFSAKEIWKNDTINHRHIFPMNNGNFFCTGVYRDNRIKIVDKQGKLQKSLFEYPYRDASEKAINPRVRAMAYSGSIAAKPSGDAFVQATGNGNMIFIYKLKDGDITVKEIIKSYPTYKPQEGNSGYSAAMPANAKRYYSDVTATNQYIFLLYSGKTFKDNGMDALYGDWILVYNWEGDLVRKLHLDLPTELICASPDNNFLYTVSLNPDYKVIKYKLPAIE